MDYPIAHESVIAAFPDFTVDPNPLGTGGMKNAYRVTRGSDSSFVLKVIRQPLQALGDDDEIGVLPDRIIREIRAMREVDHPAIVRILEGPAVREIDGSPRGWYLEPYYPGGALSVRLGEPWAENAVVELFAPLLGAIEALTLCKLVHRDIKPDNIVYDSSNNPVLLDLGIALFLDLTPITASAAFSPRTPTFAAPEQWLVRREATHDFRTDLFLLGMCGFWALTGVHPFHPEQQPGYLDRLMDGQVDKAALAAVSPSEGMHSFLNRMLQPHPSGRFRKIEHAFSALEACR